MVVFILVYKIARHIYSVKSILLKDDLEGHINLVVLLVAQVNFKVYRKKSRKFQCTLSFFYIVLPFGMLDIIILYSHKIDIKCKFIVMRL